MSALLHPAETEALAVRASHGDRVALGELYEGWSDRVYRFVLAKVSGHRQAAEDLASEVWVRVARGIRTYAPSPSRTFAGWLFTVARNTLTDAWRRTKRVVEIPTADLFDTSLIHAGPIGTGDLNEYLHEAIAGLPPKRAQVVTLRFFIGLSVEETAIALGITADAVKAQTCRALKDLRSALGRLVDLDKSAPHDPVIRVAEPEGATA